LPPEPGSAAFERAVLEGLVLARRELSPPGSWVGGNPFNPIGALDDDGVPLGFLDYVQMRSDYIERLIEEGG
jgi:hypothetical protein